MDLVLKGPLVVHISLPAIACQSFLFFGEPLSFELLTFPSLL
jgi:hypothetical protein